MLRRFTCGTVDIAVNLSPEPRGNVAPYTAALFWLGGPFDTLDIQDYADHPATGEGCEPYPDLATWLAAGACSEACDADSLCAGALAYDERSDMFILIPVQE